MPPVPLAPAGAIIQEMGWFNLFTRGLPLRIVMIGTLTGLQWGEPGQHSLLPAADGVQKLPPQQRLRCARSCPGLRTRLP